MKAGAPSPLTCFRRMRTERLSLGICARDSTEAIKRQLTHVRAWAHVGSARSSREAASACAAATVPECKRRGGGAPLRSSRSAHCGHSPLFPLARPRRRSHPWMCLQSAEFYCEEHDSRVRDSFFFKVIIKMQRICKFSSS